MSVRVSDHAVLRYMERVLGVDVEELRAIIAASCERHQGAPCVRTIRARFLISGDGCVVTTLDGETIPAWDVLARLLREADST